MKQLILFGILLGFLFTSCSTINETMWAIENNRQAIDMSTQAIEENAQAIREATQGIEENRRELEKINQLLRKESAT